ncbi:MAG: arginase family protein [Candidatus Heimdallarchaeota archaeon]|nr:arginase family protein [Candidatus Heimdallarchaeota archaeon]
MKNTFIGFFKADDVEAIDDKESVFLFGVPFERVKATRGGSKKAPEALRKQSLEFSGISTDFDINEEKTNFYDLGNIHPIKQKREIGKIWKKSVETNSKILVLGGDHSITYDTLINAPWDKDTALIWIDAHADLADEYPPGIFKSHGTVFTNLKEELELKKEQMLFIGGHAYTLTSTEFHKIQKENTTNYISTQKLLENKGEGLETLREFASRFKTIYLSIDADALDQAFVPTVATMEPFGITPSVLVEILNILLPKSKYVDFVELGYTRTNKIALNFGVGLIFRILEIWSNKS